MLFLKTSAILLLASIFCTGQTSTGPAEAKGTCSTANTGNSNTFTINCGIGKQQGEAMLAIINKILANQLDPAAVMSKLNEISQSVQGMKARRLTVEQTESIAHLAKTACLELGKINVTAANANQEAQRYAWDFVTVFKSAGCEADLALPIPGLTPDVTGIHIAVRDYNNIGMGARLLAKILSNAGIEYQINPTKPDFFPNDSYVLVIGAKEH